jgi:hypothetical protein
MSMVCECQVSANRDLAAAFNLLSLTGQVLLIPREAPVFTPEGLRRIRLG